MITIQETQYKIARRGSEPALMDGGKTIVVFNPHDPHYPVYLPIEQLPF